MTNTMSCGCKIISDNLGAYKIEYCPKHKAALDMCEALKALMFQFAVAVEHPYSKDKEIYEQAEQALSKAGERCIP